MTPKRHWPAFVLKGVTHNILPRLPGSHAVSAYGYSVVAYKNGQEVLRYNLAAASELPEVKQEIRERFGPGVMVVMTRVPYNAGLLHLQFTSVRKYLYDRIDNSIRQDQKDPDLA